MSGWGPHRARQADKSFGFLFRLFFFEKRTKKLLRVARLGGKRALALSIRARGPDQEDSLWIEGNLADDYLNAGDLAHAEAIDRDVVARGEKLFTHGEWDLPRFRCLLGEILAHEGKTAEAKALLTPGVAALRAAVGADSADTRRAQTALAALGG